MATFKLVRKLKSPKVLHNEVRQEIVKSLKPVAKSSEESRGKIVANWNNKPSFKSTITVTPDRIEITTVVRRGQRLKSGKATTADLWNWIDKTGTRSHAIPDQPKRQGSLALQWGGPGSYQSKTGANPARYGGPGRVSGGQPTFRKQVQHPGFKARNFTEVINKDLNGQFNKAVDAGYKRGFRRISAR